MPFVSFRKPSRLSTQRNFCVENDCNPLMIVSPIWTFSLQILVPHYRTFPDSIHSTPLKFNMEPGKKSLQKRRFLLGHPIIFRFLRQVSGEVPFLLEDNIPAKPRLTFTVAQRSVGTRWTSTTCGFPHLGRVVLSPLEGRINP